MFEVEIITIGKAEGKMGWVMIFIVVPLLKNQSC